MRIKKHDKSYIVELEDRSKWRIWPGDIAVTLQWLPTADIVKTEIEDEFCTHALINRSRQGLAYCRGSTIVEGRVTQAALPPSQAGEGVQCGRRSPDAAFYASMIPTISKVLGSTMM